MTWEQFRGDTVVGDVRVLRGELDRDLYAYLPPSYGNEGRFPVLYMHDGQNLFDEPTSANGEWRVDETMEELAREGIEAIVVGVPNAGDHRAHEYAGTGMHEYLAFLAERVKPLVDTAFDTDPARQSTGLAGSSLGGFVSLVGFFRRAETFGLAGVMSPAFWWNDEIYEIVERADFAPGKIWMDVGSDEHPENPQRSRLYVDAFQRMTEILRAKGYGDESLRTVLDDGAIHHESAWARRLPDMLRFLLGR